MKRLVVVVLAFCVVAVSKDKPVLQVRTIFLEGRDTEAMEMTKLRLEKLTCMHLTDVRGGAEAVLKIDQGPTRPMTGVSKTPVSMTLSTVDGKFIWERSHTGVEFSHSGVDDAVKHLLSRLAKDEGC